MVGFLPTKKEEEKREQVTKNQSLSDIFDFSLPLTDCFVDFDPIKEWLEEDPPIGPPPYNMDDMGVGRSDFGVAGECVKLASGVGVSYVDGEAKKVETLGILEQENGKGMNVEKDCLGYESVKVGALVNVVHESAGGVGVEKIDSKEGELEEVGFLIEEELKRVSLNRELNDSGMVGGGSKIGTGVVGDEANMAKIDIVGDGVNQSDEILNVEGDEGRKEEVVSDKDESGSESVSESESSSSSSGSSSSSSSDTSSDDEEDEEDQESKRKTGTDMEEGEIMASAADEMVAWSDDEDADGVKGPIMSKNEISDLPPVPAVNISLLPHHSTLPVGIILSIMGPQVIVEGVETHNPLSEGSILWITESRSPLGLVDEIFGPVKNPYYIVRYNSETEVPAGVQEGTQISFVPEYADHVLNNANLYRKGYDASGENDEELSEEMEFSDDEKEAEYKKLKKMKKRGTKDDKGGEDRKNDKRKSKNRFGVEKHEQFIAKQTNNVSTQHFEQHPGVSSGTRGLMPSHPLPHLGMSPGSNATTSNNVWLNGNPTQQTAGSGFPINPQMQGMNWLQGNHPQQQTPFLNMAPFQNIHMNPSLAANLAAAMAGQPNFGQGPAFAPFPGGVSPNFFNQALFGMGMQGNAPTQTNFGANTGSSSQLQHGGVAQNFLNQSIMGMGMQGQNASTNVGMGMGMQGQNASTNMGMGMQGQNASTNMGMGMQGQNASTATNAGANAVSSNGFQSMAMSNPGQDAFQNFNPDGQDASQNFNPGTHRRGGRRPYHRGGGRFGGGRGRRPS